jgi:hypothetical protein
VQVMPPQLARPPLGLAAIGRKHPLPDPLPPGIGVFAFEHRRRLHTAGAASRSLRCSSTRSTCCASSASIVAGGSGPHLLADFPTCYFVASPSEHRRNSACRHRRSLKHIQQSVVLLNNSLKSLLGLTTSRSYSTLEQYYEYNVDYGSAKWPAYLCPSKRSKPS